MKFYKSFFVVIFLVWGNQIAFSQNTKIPEIQGDWEINIEEQIKNQSKKNLEKYNSLSEKEKKSTSDNLGSRIYRFLDDQVFESSWASQGGVTFVKGEWELREKDVVVIILEGGYEYKYSYKVTGKNLVLISLDSEDYSLSSINLKRIQ